MNPSSNLQPHSFLPFLLNRNVNLLPPSVADGGGPELKGVEWIYHYSENVFAHRGVTMKSKNKVGVGFLRQITVIRFGSFPRSLTDRYVGENGLWGQTETKIHCVERLYVPAFHYVLPSFGPRWSCPAPSDLK